MLDGMLSDEMEKLLSMADEEKALAENAMAKAKELLQESRTHFANYVEHSASAGKLQRQYGK